MKKIFKFLSIMFICFAITSMSNLSVVKVKADTMPVQLYYAYCTGFYPHPAGNACGYVKVKGSSSKKNVTIHYNFDHCRTNYDSPEEWDDISATYLRLDSDGNEIWGFKIPETYFGKCYFAIKCEMDGQTYWDNNGGKNYMTSYSTNIFATIPLHLVGASHTSLPNSKKISEFHGKIVLDNLGYEKDVIIRYTTDNWKTYNEEKANFGFTSIYGNIDAWTFQVNLDEPSENVEFAVMYRVNGQEYWDNNFGTNYDATKHVSSL